MLKQKNNARTQRDPAKMNVVSSDENAAWLIQTPFSSHSIMNIEASLGYNWTTDTIEYVIGLKHGVIENANCSVALPDSGWISVKGKTAELGLIYQEIYAKGILTYEIEAFTAEGECEVVYYR